ncbi:hypothetical protein RBS60_04370 [Sinomonas sp. ASV486]|uniref:hypothetical protein n=1 Tax=Sinomonas sp. ASV486 TaxID=3051170 RepID=UPI0027DADA25|nr:hypothetical protein [Sinomonas sp. ASV486]MDQ4489433.1 hypothetical protein [Sinomonas sp. ASV486]
MSVPAADEAVVAWMELQDNPSLSVRMLIRESIERLGYIDVVNRPVAQLPGGVRSGGSSPEDTAGSPARGSAAAQPRKAPDQRPWPAQEAEPARESRSEPEPPSAGPMDINDIFAMTR